VVDREHRQYLSTFKCGIGATASALVAQHERQRVDGSGVAGVRDFRVFRLARRPLEQDAVADDSDLRVLVAVAEIDHRDLCELGLGEMLAA
jgi:hypothetical protein